MNKTASVPCFTTPLGVFISCPVCKAKRLMRLYPETTGAGVALYCRRCKREIVVDIQPGNRPDRVTMRKISLAGGLTGSDGGGVKTASEALKTRRKCGSNWRR